MTIKEIAQLAGVSASTVSKIINEKDGSINPETRRRVLTIVKKYNYIPYANIKVASSAKTFIIGVLRRSCCNSSQLVNGILQAAQAHGYNILLFDSNCSYDEELKHITALCRSNVDGVIWEPVGVNSLQSGHYLAECNIPICYVNTPHIPSACNINFKDMGYELAKKLLGLGHKKIACLLDPKQLNSQPMLEGIQKCLYDCHIPLPQKMCFYDSSEHYFQELLNGNYSAVVSNSYTAALNFYQKAKQLHCDIPEAFSLCCLQDDYYSNNTVPIISALEIPYQSLGTYVAETLIKNIEEDIPVTPESFSPHYAVTHPVTLDVPAAPPTKELVVIGSICVNLSLTADSFPESGKTTSILNSVPSLGGNGAIQALSAVKLGCNVSLIGKIGKDSDTCFLYDTLQKAEINTCGIFCSSNIPTGKIYQLSVPGSESTTAIFQGANAALCTDEIEKQEHLFKTSQLALISGGIPDNVLLKSLKLSKKYDLQTVFYPFMTKEIFPEWIPYIDFLVVGETEASTLCPTHADAAIQAEYLYALGLPVVLIIQKDGQIFLKSKNTKQFLPPVPTVSDAAPQTADSFLAAFSAYLLKGYKLNQAIRIAQYASELSIKKDGRLTLAIDDSTLKTYISNTEPNLLIHS